MGGSCSTCRHWTTGEEQRGLPKRVDRIVRPIDPDTYEPMDMPFEVRVCQHPRLLFCERPIEPDGFAVADGSEYFAVLYTAEAFGCVLHEAAP